MFAKVVFIVGMLISAAAQAQEYGFVAGVHQTGASTDSEGNTIDSQFNFKTGLAMGFELAPKMRFRTGALFNRRHVDLNVAPNTKYKIKFDYIDVPANFQYNFNDTVGLFGGLVVGINVADKVEAPIGSIAADPQANGLIPLADVGVNLLFEDMIGFDFYYERGLGKFADHWSGFSTFGGNFIYWF